MKGDFQQAATYEALKRNYYWPRMNRDVAHVVSMCMVCQRNEKMNPLEAPAKCPCIVKFNSRVSFDIIGGLPPTPDGYVNILTGIDSLTKTVRLWALRTKSAQEVAEKVWEWITWFGPPGEILTDQGKEFTNEMLKELLNLAGVIKRITSAYNPNTNGVCERTNQEAMRMLRKFAEANPLLWAKLLGIVQLFLNCHKSETTGFEPHYLLYGEYPNEFKDFEPILKEILNFFVQNRARGIEKLNNVTRPTAVDNIEHAQEKQLDVQNTRTNATAD